MGEAKVLILIDKRSRDLIIADFRQATKVGVLYTVIRKLIKREYKSSLSQNASKAKSSNVWPSARY